MDLLLNLGTLIIVGGGAVLSVYLLQACAKGVDVFYRNQLPGRYPPPHFLGGALFLALLIGLPILVVLCGYATGRLH